MKQRSFHSKTILIFTCIVLLTTVVSVQPVQAQQTVVTNTNVIVPPVIQFSNVATSEAGNPLTGTVEITFSLYSNFEGGDPLWSETQNVTLDNAGHYSVYVGITKQNGVPMSLFTTGQAHWLGVQIAGQPEQVHQYSCHSERSRPIRLRIGLRSRRIPAISSHLGRDVRLACASLREAQPSLNMTKVADAIS